MMRTTVVVIALAWVVGVQAAEVFEWTDGDGKRHYSNVPAESAERKPIDVEQGMATTRLPEEESRRGEAGAAAAGSSSEQAAFSADASLRRQAMERDLRQTDRKLRELDERLAALARARTAHAAGSDATGGVKTAAAEVRSEEEKGLGTQREELVKHQEAVRGDYAKLKAEVSAKLGGTPPWWIELR